MSTEVSDSLKIPDDLIVRTEVGWGEVGEDVHVRLASLLLPPAYRLVIACNRTPEWIVTFYFKVREGSRIGLQRVDADGIDVPTALEILTARISIKEWERMAASEIVVRDLLEGLGHDALRWVEMTDLAKRGTIQEVLKERFGDEPIIGPAVAPSGVTRHDLQRLWADRVDRTVRPRVRITTDHLQDVADTYRAASAEGTAPTRAVADHFGVSHSTAARWVGMARRQGLLPPTDPGKERA